MTSVEEDHRSGNRRFFDLDASFVTANLNGGGRRSWYPDSDDERIHRTRFAFGRGKTLFPDFRPSFGFQRGCRVFTIGSCFAREIEENLYAYDLPTRRFSVPDHESPSTRPNALLNEYNAGTISQRVERAYRGTKAPHETIIQHPEGGFVDLLLPTSPNVSRDRALERRQEIDAIYGDLPGADVVIVTLGLIEVWLDTYTDTYINRMPPSHQVQEAPDRYRLHAMDVDSAYPRLQKAFRMILEAGSNIVVTVSPVPLIATMTTQDATVANALSKAVLRVCAQRLAELPGVDYFPSYEIVMSGGLASFTGDNIHVKPSLVAEITQFMLRAYERPRA